MATPTRRTGLLITIASAMAFAPLPPESPPRERKLMLGTIDGVDGMIALEIRGTGLLGAYAGTTGDGKLVKGCFRTVVTNGRFVGRGGASERVLVEGRIDGSDATGAIVCTNGTTLRFSANSNSDESNGVRIGTNERAIAAWIDGADERGIGFGYDSGKRTASLLRTIPRDIELCAAPGRGEFETRTSVLVMAANDCHRRARTNAARPTERRAAPVTACEAERDGSIPSGERMQPSPWASRPTFRYAPELKRHLWARDPGGKSPGFLPPAPSKQLIRRQKDFATQAERLRASWTKSPRALEQAVRQLKQTLLISQ